MGRVGKPGSSLLLSCLLLCAALALPDSSLSAQSRPDGKHPASENTLRTAQNPSPCADCKAFNDLNSRIRDCSIGRFAAQALIPRLLSGIKRLYLERGGRNCPPSAWVFPVEGATPRAIGGGGRAGYISRGYDYFDGNRHGGHPSFDIFIVDRDRDELDDKTGTPVRVLSMAAGVVVAVEEEWGSSSRLRGGKYVWVYDAPGDALVYYAHNRDVLVSPGDMVEPGDPIATVGRSGLNAHKARSPTHLHMTFLALSGGTPSPRNIYDILKNCRTAATPGHARKEGDRKKSFPNPLHAGSTGTVRGGS